VLPVKQKPQAVKAVEGFAGIKPYVQNNFLKMTSSKILID